MKRFGKIQQLYKLAVNAENEELRGEFVKHFSSENPRKAAAIADQWYARFRKTTEYGLWNSLSSLDQVIDRIKNAPIAQEFTEEPVEESGSSYLLEQHPQQRHDLLKLDQNFLSWANSRWGRNASAEEPHPIYDALQSLLLYQEKLPSLKQKVNTNQTFANLIAETFQGRNIASIKDFSTDEMEKIMAFSERRKTTSDLFNPEFEPKEFLGKFGEWNLWMPHSREDSIYIAGFDADTLEPDVTWCTARTAGSNLFYSYAGSGIILFYVIKDGASKGNSDDYQSIGFVDGEPQYQGDNGVTVNGANRGMTEEEYAQLFGPSFDAIYSKMREKAGSLDGKHPVAEKFDKAVLGDEAVYADLIRGVEPDGVENIDEQISSRKFEIASDTNTPADTLDRLAGDERESVRSAVAGNPNTPADLLDRLADDISESVRSAVAGNTNIPADLLNRLVGDIHENVRAAVARNPNIPADALVILAGDQYSYVRFDVARNPNIPDDILVILAGDIHENVRSAVAGNPNIPADILIKLAGDENYYVRASAAENPNISVDMLIKLAGDKSYYVRSAVAENLNTPADMLIKLTDDGSHWARAAVAGNLNAPADLLDRLAGDIHDDVRYAAAKNTNTPVDALVILADDIYERVRSSLAENPNTPDYILERLVGDPYEYVRAIAAEALRKRQEKNQVVASSAAPIMKRIAALNVWLHNNGFNKFVL